MSLFRSEPVQPVISTQQPGTSDKQGAEDTVTLSQEGLEKSQQQNAAASPSQDETPSESSQETKQDSGQSSSLQEMTAEEEKMVIELKQRDQEVRAHEAAHLAAAGQYAKGGASYTYQKGPDGRRYAIGGEVPIDVSEEKTPEETIQKMRTLKRAAMAPAEPSSTDRSVAANASATEARASQELRAEENDASQPQSASESPADEESDGLAASTPPSKGQPQVDQVAIDVIA